MTIEQRKRWSACLVVAPNMADGSQNSNSVPNSVQNKPNASGVSGSQPQTSQPVASSTSTATASHVDTKVRNAGASLAEFLTQLDDYSPTVRLIKFEHFLYLDLCLLVYNSMLPI